MPNYSNTLSAIIPVLILVYIYYLESEKCKCVMDWRHNYIKYYLLAMIIYSIISEALHLDINKYVKDQKFTAVVLITSPILITISVYFYAMFTYIGDLDKTQCQCAVHDMKYMHNILYYVRYLMLVGAFILTAIVTINILGLFAKIIS
jgi:hypothetical protein